MPTTANLQCLGCKRQQESAGLSEAFFDVVLSLSNTFVLFMFQESLEKAHKARRSSSTR